jgi:ribosomal protein S18 acetylase RimI-like enzyme
MLCLRTTQPEDEAFLLTLFAETRAGDFAALGLAEAQLGSLLELQYRGRKMTYAAQYPDAEDSILLGEDGQPVGRLLLDRKPDRWRIVDLAVLTEQRGRGLGSKVLEECCCQAAAAGASLELQVAPQNPAQRLYARLGFRAVREDAVSIEMTWNAAEKA